MIEEGRAIQHRFYKATRNDTESKEKRFIKLMEEGKVSAALRCIGSQASNVLKPSADVITELANKHPDSKMAVTGGLIQGPLPKKAVEEVIFENLDAFSIFKAAKKVNGAAGPSGGDADLWQRMLCSKQFKKKPAELCEALADLAKKLNTSEVNPKYLRAFVAGRLIPLDKNPGVRPIGIGETIRRIISSATTTLLKPELVSATAPTQTCAGIPGGIEASIHAMREMYDDPNTEGVLLVDASNAFNALNRKTALRNIQYTCPEFATFIRNIYRCEAEMFVSNSDLTILSKEGTTQGGPESMGFYAISAIPLSKVKTKVGDENEQDRTKQIYYADDGGAAGTLTGLKRWWDEVQKDGPMFGYFPNPSKTWLVVKEAHLDRATEMFSDIKISVEGRKYLGSFIGTEDGKTKFVDEKIGEWSKDIDALAQIGISEPQLAYAAYIYGTSKRWQFVCRTTPGISPLLQKLEDQIREKLVPIFTGRANINVTLRRIFSLPARLGGLSIQNPSLEADNEYQSSLQATLQLKESIIAQKDHLVIDNDRQKATINGIRRKKEERADALRNQLQVEIPEDLFKLIELSSEKGASSWLTSLPLKQFGFRLNKQEFADAITLRYDLKMSDVSKSCVCGEPYAISHCLTCKKGGFINIRHNVVRDTTHKLLTEVCRDVRLEPALQPVTGEDLPVGTNITNGARSDVSALGLWAPLTRAFFDIRVFNPLAPSNWSKQIPDMYTHHEDAKKKEYNARIIQIERASFTPLVFSCSGGMSSETGKFIKQLARKISEKKQDEYSQVVAFIRRRIRFDILRSCVISLRGERASFTAQKVTNLDFSLRRTSDDEH